MADCKILKHSFYILIIILVFQILNQLFYFFPHRLYIGRLFLRPILSPVWRKSFKRKAFHLFLQAIIGFCLQKPFHQHQVLSDVLFICLRPVWFQTHRKSFLKLPFPIFQILPGAGLDTLRQRASFESVCIFHLVGPDAV